MASPSTIPAKFLIISDTHNFEFEDHETNPLPLHLPTPKADVLLHCGDLTQFGGLSCYKKALKMLGQIPAELKVVIAGNHELDLDKSWWEGHPGWWDGPEESEDYNLAIGAMTGPLAAEAGVTYLTEGTHTFTLESGARFTIYVSPYTPAFEGWAFPYERHEDRYNGLQQVAPDMTSIATKPIPNNVDIVMTHGPPKGVLDWCPQGNVGCENLLNAIRRIKPMMHCFGHIHEGHGMEVMDWKKMAAAGGPQLRKNEAVHKFFEDEDEEAKNPYPEPLVWRGAKGKKTLAINAAIMNNEDNMPKNTPWLVELELPSSHYEGRSLRLRF